MPNPDDFLKPGMFGRLRLEASRAYPALLVPAEAIVADASRRVVYVLGKGDAIEMRAVELGPLSGNLRVVRSGITQKDRVVIAGVVRVRPGQKVSPKKGEIRQEKPAAVPVDDEAAASSIALPAGQD